MLIYKYWRKTMNLKSILKSFFALAILALAFSAQSYAEDNLKECKIKTSAHCNSCKVKIEKAVNNLDGVEKSYLNLDDKVVSVKYNPAKTSVAKIEKAIADAGYEAKDVNAKSGCCSKKSAECKKKCSDEKKSESK